MKPVIGFTIILATCLFHMCCNGKAASPDQDMNLKNGNSASGAKMHRQAPEANPDNMSGEEHYGQANNLKQGLESEEALKEYNLAIEKGYDTAELRYELGHLLATQLNRHEDAVEQFRKAVQIDNTNWRAHWALAQSLLEIKRYKEAWDELQIVRRLDPEGESEGHYTYYVAKSLDGLERYNEALNEYEAFLERASKIRPGAPDVREAKARIKVLREKLNRN